jgi:hypothetical protein
MSHMFNLDTLRGILLAIARPELTIYQNEKKNIGYEIRVRINVRADSRRFLEEINSCLLENNIRCKVKYNEGKHRPKPILWISGIRHIVNVCELLNGYPSAKGNWAEFTKAVNIIYEGRHNTQEGLDTLLRIKGEIL